MLPLIKTASPQTAEVYKLLKDGQALSALDIAEKLDILPNAVYRVVKKLIDMGLVEQTGDYPVRFKAVPAQTALSMYMVAASRSFRRQFGMTAPASTAKQAGPTISLIKDRSSMLRRGDIDALSARQSIDVIVSGHDVPESTFLAYKKAAKSGVIIRKIVHQKEQAGSPMVARWQEFGARVKYLPDFQMRMIVFDKLIVYLTSYDTQSPGSAFGVRFEYEPLALQMTTLFEQHWQNAQSL
jgi:sugar-specific transcriptional regulator TrmB